MGVTDDGSIPVIVARTRIKISFKNARQFPAEVRNGSPIRTLRKPYCLRFQDLRNTCFKSSLQAPTIYKYTVILHKIKPCHSATFPPLRCDGEILTISQNRDQTRDHIIDCAFNPVGIYNYSLASNTACLNLSAESFVILTIIACKEVLFPSARASAAR